MGYLSFEKKFEINLNFVDFYSLTHAIPRSWKTNPTQTKIKLDANTVYQKVLNDILSMDKVCKRTYWTFVNIPVGQKFAQNRSISYRLQDIFNVLFSAKIQDGRQKWRKLKFFPSA